jgi:hypothetical protein
VSWIEADRPFPLVWRRQGQSALVRGQAMLAQILDNEGVQLRIADTPVNFAYTCVACRTPAWPWPWEDTGLYHRIAHQEIFLS